MWTRRTGRLSETKGVCVCPVCRLSRLCKTFSRLITTSDCDGDFDPCFPVHDACVQIFRKALEWESSKRGDVCAEEDFDRDILYAVMSQDGAFYCRYSLSQYDYYE